MGKRNSNTIVLVSSSSDDDDGDKDGRRSLSLNRSYSKPKAKSIVTRTNPRAPKKPRVSGSRSRTFKPNSNVDEFEFFDGDVNEVFTGLKVSQSAGLTRRGSQELWVDKYRPCTFEELAVHKKKVEEVKAWFEQRLNSSKDKFADYVLVVTGPAGVGKSATIHVIASSLGAVVCEWDTPTPTIWKEHIYSSNAGIHYMSKLDEFEHFVERIRKYGLISPSFNGDSKSPVILLIDDLPLAYGKVGCKRLKKCLHLLVQSIQLPTAIVLTDYDQAHSEDGTARFLEELKQFLESAGACKIMFNPITNNSIKRTLSKICSLEQCNVTTEQIDLIAKASGGDLRHAITSLQFLCVQDCNVSDSIDSLKHDAPMDDLTINFGRDGTLSLFHALGKFLHNKRENGSSCLWENDRLRLQEKYTRLPMKMDAPEKVLSQAHGQARPVTEFLHENVLDFLGEEAMDDAWTVLSYLSEADLLLDDSFGARAKYNVAEGVQQASAASVAVRGTLFGNFHPLPPRWHAIRKPKLWQVEKLSVQYKHEITRQAFTAYGGVSTSDVSVIATEYMPVYKWIQHRMRGDLNQIFSQGNGIRDVEMDQMNLDDIGTDSSEDEIEDW